MQTAITARHFELAPQMKEYVTKRLEKLERYSHYIMDAEMILAKDAGMELVEGKLHLRHDVLTAKVQANDLYLAVTEVVDRLLTQLKRHDERVKARKRVEPRRAVVR
jgi:putative sigma-54 modulation protein